ncbi:MAG: hypothetical protein LJE94_14095 [Deltaproteobacteria bacterium]|jgi:hypothetical protein|nr:hypothetical protein [Deltaproteobacteria bacterium]
MAERNFFAVGAIAVIVLILLNGCYPKRVGPAGPDGKALTWSEMSMAQRKVHMRQVVLPRAAAIFREWRPDRHAQVDCSLCHGQGAVSEDYAMPTDHLPRLSGEVLLGPEFEQYPDTTRLKLNRLVPEMSDALGLKSFSIITRRGFGCYSCHLGPTGPMFGN